MRYLYLITNKTTNEKYIGQTNNFERRVKAHKYSKDCYIGKAICEFGKDNFTFEILAICEDHMIDEMETKAIRTFDCLYPKGYNFENGGCRNKKSHPTTTAKIVAKTKGQKRSEEVRKRMSLSHIGKSPNNKGVPKTEEQKRVLSDSMKKYFENNPDHKERLRLARLKFKENEEQKVKRGESIKAFYTSMTQEEREAHWQKRKNKSPNKTPRKSAPKEKKNRSEIAKKKFEENPELKKKISESMKKLYKDKPEMLVKRGEAIKRFYSSMTPEQRAQYIKNKFRKNKTESDL